jgi:AraC-like DNA-binding protein
MSQSSKDRKPIGVVKAAFAEPFRIAMLNNGVDPEPYFRRNRLPLQALDDPELQLPVKSFFQLVNQVAIEQGIPDFGMQAAQVKPWYEIETMHPVLAAQPTLEALLETFCRIASGESNVARFELQRPDGICHFQYLSPPYINNDIQMELYRISGMIDLIRVFAGKDWRPDSVELMMAENRIAAKNSVFAGCPLRFSRPGTAVVFARDLLSLEKKRKTASGHESAQPHRSVGRLEATANPIPVLRKMLQSYVTEPNLSLGLVADIAGMTPRGLQRLLKAHGSSFRELVNDARLNYALRQLDDSNTSIVKIASDLCYREAGHFTRAFKRLTGLTPSKYRRQNSR